MMNIDEVSIRTVSRPHPTGYILRCMCWWEALPTTALRSCRPYLFTARHTTLRPRKVILLKIFQ